MCLAASFFWRARSRSDWMIRRLQSWVFEATTIHRRIDSVANDISASDGGRSSDRRGAWTPGRGRDSSETRGVVVGGGPPTRFPRIRQLSRWRTSFDAASCAKAQIRSTGIPIKAESQQTRRRRRRGERESLFRQSSTSRHQAIVVRLCLLSLSPFARVDATRRR